MFYAKGQCSYSLKGRMARVSFASFLMKLSVICLWLIIPHTLLSPGHIRKGEGSLQAIEHVYLPNIFLVHTDKVRRISNHPPILEEHFKGCTCPGHLKRRYSIDFPISCHKDFQASKHVCCQSKKWLWAAILSSEFQKCGLVASVPLHWSLRALGRVLSLCNILILWSWINKVIFGFLL